jgi:hypothetical protein
MLFFRNARARTTHVEATLNHPFAAQVGFVVFESCFEYDSEKAFDGDAAKHRIDKTDYARGWDGSPMYGWVVSKARFCDLPPSSPGQQKRAKFPTSKAHISAVFHSLRLIFGRAIISRNGLEAWILFPERARAEHSR